MRSEHTYGYGDAGSEGSPFQSPLFGGWTGEAIGLMDLDAFFASVEQLDHPEWRGEPVIVGGSSKSRGVVSTASYEARAFGVHSAMPSAQAERLCPDAIWVPVRHERYRELSSKVMDILTDETPYVDQVSIDEAFFDITPGRFSDEHPVAIANRIAERVSALGITCSIGLGANKTVAKIASEMQKPKGLTIVAPGTERGFLSPLPVGSISGVGGRTEMELSRIGIRTIGQLAAAPHERLAAVFGTGAEAMRQRALGLERSTVRRYDEPEEAKSVSNERTFATDLTARKDIEAAIALLGESVGRRLRAKGLAGRTVTLKLRYAYDSGRTCQRKLAHPTDDENIFVPVALELLDKIWSPGMPVRLAGMGISGFNEASGIQMDLFCDLDERGAVASDKRSLSVALDAVRARFGDSAVAFGRSTRLDG